MFKYLLKVTFRNILKDKVYSCINIASLSIGLTCSFFMLIYILNELRYDRMHEKHNRIYRVISKNPLFKTKNSTSPLTLGPLLKEGFPEIEKMTRIVLFPEAQIKRKSAYEEAFGIYCVDNDIFDIFTLPLIAGNKANLLTEPNSVVISEKNGKKILR